MDGVLDGNEPPVILAPTGSPEASGQPKDLPSVSRLVLQDNQKGGRFDNGNAWRFSMTIRNGSGEVALELFEWNDAIELGSAPAFGCRG